MSIKKKKKKKTNERARVEKFFIEIKGIYPTDLYILFPRLDLIQVGISVMF